MEFSLICNQLHLDSNQEKPVYRNMELNILLNQIILRKKANRLQNRNMVYSLLCKMNRCEVNIKKQWLRDMEMNAHLIVSS